MIKHTRARRMSARMEGKRVKPPRGRRVNARIEGKRKKSTACSRNMIKKTFRRPIASENQAQSSRPAPFAAEMIPTRPAPAAALEPVISWAIGEACEIMLMPAVVFKKSIAQRTYHCQVDRASLSVQLRACSWVCCLVEGCQPVGAQPSGGLRIIEAPTTTMIK